MNIRDYLDVLQKEYISYYFRSKIYPKPHSDKYRSYCLDKKTKIEDVSKKCNSPNIFTDQIIKQQYIEKFSNPFGLPNFQYRDEKSREIMGYWDKVYFYQKGEVVCDYMGNEFVIHKNICTQQVLVLETPEGWYTNLSYLHVSKPIINFFKF